MTTKRPQASAGGTMNDLGEIFDKQPKVLSPEQAAELIGSTRATVYDWHYRPTKYGIPDGMIIKFGRRLLVRTDLFKDWFLSRCA